MPLDPIAALQILSTIAETCGAILGIFAMVVIFLMERHRERIKDRERIWERSIAAFYDRFFDLTGPGFKELVREIGYEAVENVFEKVKKKKHGQVPQQIVAEVRNLRVEWDELEELRSREIMPKNVFFLFVVLFILIISASIYSMSHIQAGAEDVGWGLEVAISSIFIGLLIGLACLGVLIWLIASPREHARAGKTMDAVTRLKEIGFLLLLVIFWFGIHELAHFILAPWPFVKSYRFSLNPPGWQWFFNQPVSFWLILPSQLAGGLAGATYWFILQRSKKVNELFQGKRIRLLFYYYAWFLIGREIPFAFAEAFRYSPMLIQPIAELFYTNYLGLSTGAILAVCKFVIDRRAKISYARRKFA